MPAIRMFNTGFSAVGNRDGWNPIFRDERTYTLSTNLTKMKGRHDFRGGYLMNFFYLDHWQPETGNPRGQFDFNGAVTALNGAGAQGNNFYNQFASFLLGYVGTPSKSVQNELMTAREWQHSFYVRDRWTPNNKLTLDLGLRYELYPIMHRADGRGVDRLDLTNADFNHRLDVLIAGRGDNPQNNGMKMSWNNFAPRLGAIYRLNEHTVFRTGYGLTYNATPWARAVRGDNDYPITIAASFPNVDAFGFRRRWRRASRRSFRRTRAPAGSRSIAARPNTRRRPATSIAATCRRGTSRSSAASCSTCRSTSPTSAPRAPAATPRSTSTPRRCSAPATRGVRTSTSGASSRSTPGAIG